MDNRIGFRFPGASMGILDDAIREHLELKRQHGAGDDELKTLEGEAFGPPERPGSEGPGSDTAAEAPTEFMAQPDTAEGQIPDPAGPPDSESVDIKVRKSDEPSRQRPESGAEVADLQEAPEPGEPADEANTPAPEQAKEGSPSTPLPEPVEEESPAMEHEAIVDPAPEPEPPSPQGPTTEEREAIADPPTELYDVEGEEFGSASEAPSDDELVEEEIAEPRLAPADPLSNLDEAVAADDDEEAPGEEPDLTVAKVDEEDDFFDEKRLSDELDQALDVPLDPPTEDPVPAEPASERPVPAEPLEPVSEPEEPSEPRSESAPQEGASPGSEDVLEETPDFLEEAPEDDQLWFEQKPPKDFDFDD
jgi:hypothetical protein